MYWFVAPPYARYAAAALVVLFAVWMDIRPEPTELIPVARQDIPAGAPLEGHLFEGVPMPRGVLHPVTPTGVAAVAITAGDPLIESHIAHVAPPPGWWVVRLPVPLGAAPGTEIRVVLLPSDPTKQPEAVPGVVIRPAEGPGSGFSDPEGSVAIPEESIERVALAASTSRVVVLTK